MEARVSVVVPTYQAGMYIQRSIESLINQTYTNLEIIVVDDGSTDNTKTVLQHYIDQKQIQYVYKKNGGLSDARNCGMQYVTGEYLYFLDSDDWIESTYIAKMMHQALTYQADIVLSSIIMTDGQTEKLRSDTFLHQLDEVNVRNFYSPIHFHPIMQNKLFRTSLIKNNTLSFPLGLYYEDVFFFVQAFEKAAMIVRCPEAKFYYFQHSLSIMKQTSKKLLDIETIFEKMIQSDEHLKAEAWFEYLCIRHLFLASTLRAIHAKDKALLKLVVDSHSRFVQRYFPHWRKNLFLKQRQLYTSFGQYLYAQVIRRYGYRIGVAIAKYIL